MAYNRPTLRLDVKGNRLLIRKLRAATPRLSEAQRVAGLDTGNLLVTQAKQIVQSNAPLSSGRLRESIGPATISKSRGGWLTKIEIHGAAKRYAEKVESGAPAERKKVGPELLSWVRNVLGEEAAIFWERRLKKTPNATMWVRKGNNPRYDTGTGMKFFQIPVARNEARIANDYQDRVRKALQQAKLL